MKKAVVCLAVLLLVATIVYAAIGEKKSYWNPDQLKINSLKLAGLSTLEIGVLLELPEHPEVNCEKVIINGGEWVWVREDLKVWIVFNGCEPGRIVADIRSKK